jgi:hypothetical protein
MAILTGLSVFFTRVLGVGIEFELLRIQILFSLFQCLFFMVFLCLWVFLLYVICKLVKFDFVGLLIIVL